MAILARIRQAIRDENYRITAHANEEMAEDDLFAMDIEEIILTGNVFKKYTKEPRGTRYKIVGRTTDMRTAYVICRFLPSGALLIITAYAER